MCVAGRQLSCCLSVLVKGCQGTALSGTSDSDQKNEGVFFLARNETTEAPGSVSAAAQGSSCRPLFVFGSHLDHKEIQHLPFGAQGGTANCPTFAYIEHI